MLEVPVWWLQGAAKGNAPCAAQMAALSRKAAEAQLQLTDSRRDAAEVTRYSISFALVRVSCTYLGLRHSALLCLCLAATLSKLLQCCHHLSVAGGITGA